MSTINGVTKLEKDINDQNTMINEHNTKIPNPEAHIADIKKRKHTK